MRTIRLALAATAVAGGLAATATPASAVELCDPNRFVCAYVLDQPFCPGGYQQIARVPNPLGGSVLLVCALR